MDDFDVDELTPRSKRNYFRAVLALNVVEDDPICAWLCDRRTILTELGYLPADQILPVARHVSKERFQFPYQGRAGEIVRRLRQFRRALRERQELERLVTRAKAICLRRGGPAAELVVAALDGMVAEAVDIKLYIPRTFRFKSISPTYHFAQYYFVGHKFTTTDEALGQRLMSGRYFNVDYTLDEQEES